MGKVAAFNMLMCKLMAVVILIFADTLVASSLHITATRLHTSDRRHAQDPGQ